MNVSATEAERNLSPDTLLRLLIVEDDGKSAAYLNKGLSENGFVVDVAQDGARQP